MIWRVIFICLSLVFSFSLAGNVQSAALTTNAQFEIGSLSGKDCLSNSCVINFKKTYTSTPLVFLLSSFDYKNYQNDASSVAAVESVTMTSVRIRQKLPFNNTSQKPMSPIFYFVIEQGSAVLDPSQPSLIVQTGMLIGDSHVGVNTNNKWITASFQSAFAQTPIVFTQVQGLNQSDLWATTAIDNVTQTGFKTALELGRSTIKPKGNKNIAYLAIPEFSGVTANGDKFILGSHLFNQKGLSSNAALKWSCENNVFSPNLSSDYDLLMAKQTRKGSHGGWLRFCQNLGNSNNQFSFVFDEDANDRKHGATEKIGYFAFEVPKNIVIPPQQCDAFNGMQTWRGNSINLITMENNAEITGGSPLKGQVRFTNDVVNQYPSFTPEMPINSGSCDGKNCSLINDSELSDLLSFNWKVSPEARVINGYDSNMDSQKTFMRSTYFKNPYGVGNPQGYSGFYVNSAHTLLFKTGEYWFDDMSVLGDIEIEGDVIFHVQDKINFARNVNTNNGGTLFIYSYKDSGCESTIDTSPHQPLVNQDYSLNLNSGAHVNGYIYTKGSMALSNGAKVKGAITACQVAMSNDSQFIHEPLINCGSNSYQLVISPTSGKGLACDGIEIDFSLVDSNGDVVEGKGQGLQVTSTPVAVGDRDSACWSEDGNITTPECNHADDSHFETVFPSSGPAVVTRFIHSKFLNSYNVSANVSSESLTTTEGPYEFIAKAISIVPSEGVDGSDSNQVAGRPYPFRLKIRGKENGNGNTLNCHIIKETMDIDVTFSNTVLPLTSSEEVEVYQKGNGWTEASKSLAISFVHGVAGGDENQADGSLQARLNDAGKANLSVSANIQGKMFTASERFYFRPFTAALCDQSSALPFYTNETTGAYLASGTDFNAYLKAINWIEELDSGSYGDGVPDYDNPSLVCSKAVTPSYFTHSEGSAKLSLSSLLNYPVSGDIGVITADGQSISDFNKDITHSNQNLSTIMNWNEVGTLSFDAFQNNYFNRTGFNIPSTTTSVGRFYPAYFSITNTLWDYPVNQGSSEGTYSYMAQPFDDVNFEVTAHSYSGSTVTNYGLFNTNLKASFLLTGDYNDRLNIAPSDLDNTHWSDANWETPNFSNGVIWSRKGASALAGNTTTKEDGPFNMSGNPNSVTTALGLKISGVDPVSFDLNQTVLEQELLDQPDVRYGRMVLDSVGTSVGKSVTIPLRVEYWNGNGFVISDSDNATTFNGANYCKQTIWPDPSSSSGSTLSGSNLSGINSGVDKHNLEAIADTNNADLREQVRFWLKLTEDEASSNCSSGSPTNEQPWLQYNWRGQGDEDPSTVVTFGIYRGNDRIIFRGESNIIGTSN